MTVSIHLNTGILAEIEKGHLIALELYPGQLIYGLVFDDPEAGGRTRTFFGIQGADGRGEAFVHKTVTLANDQICLDLGADWTITPCASDLAFSDFGNREKQYLLDIDSTGTAFRGLTSSDYGRTQRISINAETSEPKTGVSRNCYLIGSYDLHLSKADADNGKPPFLQMKG